MTQPPESNVPPSSDLPPPPPPPAPPPPPPAYAPPAPAPAAAAAPGLALDQVSGLMLPQGLELASVGRRIGAWFLTIPLAIVTLGIGYVIWGVVVWGRGQTPALHVLGMRCWRPQEAKVAGWWWMALREIVGRFVESFFITSVISLILLLTSRERKCLHDMIAGTVVLRDPNKVLVS